MGCSFSGLSALYDSANAGADVWINENRFRIVRQIGEGGFAFVFLVKEVVAEGASGLAGKKSSNPTHISDHGTYAMKKVIIQTQEQLELVKQEIRVSSQFSHPNLLPLLDHAIIPTKDKQGGSQKHEAYLLFPVHLDGTLLDIVTIMQSKKEFFPTLAVLQIFRQIRRGKLKVGDDIALVVGIRKRQETIGFFPSMTCQSGDNDRLCAGLKHMHSFDPPYAHNDVKPGNVLITQIKEQPPVAILMDFGSARPARKEIRSRSEALQLQEWATEHCSAPYRAPELWDCPSHADIDERTDIWSLGCTLYAIMYGSSPFEYVLSESGGSLQLAIMNAQIKWPSTTKPPYPDTLHQFVIWMLQPQPAVRPNIDNIIIHVDKLISKYSA